MEAPDATSEEKAKRGAPPGTESKPGTSTGVPSLRGTLYVSGTPIGNLGDASPRLIETIAAADLVACEDTRRTLKLLSHFGLKKPVVSIHEHVEKERSPIVINALEAGRNVVYVSDAGMPGVSDPGATLVKAVRDAGFPVALVPGPSAVTGALAISGFPGDSFVFGGFPPRKSHDRQTFFKEWIRPGITAVFFEAPYRLKKSVDDLCTAAPEAYLCLCHELTKVHESVIEGPAAEVRAEIEGLDPRGEWVIVAYWPRRR